MPLKIILKVTVHCLLHLERHGLFTVHFHFGVEREVQRENGGRRVESVSECLKMVGGRVLRGRNLRALIRASAEDVEIKPLSESDFTYRYNGYTVMIRDHRILTMTTQYEATHRNG